MIFIATPKALPKSHFKYGIFEVDDSSRLISAGWSNQIQNLTLYHIPIEPQPIWDKFYSVDNFLKAVSKDCTIFTTESHPEYFI